MTAMKTGQQDPRDNISVSSSPTSGFLRFCGILSSSSGGAGAASTPQQQNPPTPSHSLNMREQHHKYNSSSTSSSTYQMEQDGCRGKSDELQRVFTYFDENGDGKISASELQTCFRTVGGGELSDEDADKAIRTSDADGDGMLGFDDFAKLMETGEGDDKIQELRDAFSLYSTGAGAAGTEIESCITPKSLKKMLTRLGRPATTSNCKAMISKFDLNGDGVLNFDEFRIMMR